MMVAAFNNEMGPKKMSPTETYTFDTFEKCNIFKDIIYKTSLHKMVNNAQVDANCMETLLHLYRKKRDTPDLTYLRDQTLIDPDNNSLQIVLWQQPNQRNNNI